MQSETHTAPRRALLALAVCVFFFSGIAYGSAAAVQAAALSNTSLATSSTATGSLTHPPYRIDTLTGQVPGDFVVGPGQVNLTMQPGQSKKVYLSVSNRTGVAKVFTLSVEDAKGSDNPNQPITLLGSGHGPYTLKDYLHIPQTKFILQNMQRARVPVTVTLPADAEPGGRYGSVLVSITSTSNDTNAVTGAAPASAVVSRVGTLFFITIPGSHDIRGQLKSFTTIPNRSFFFHGPINFGILFQNTGSLHLDPYGEISIKNMSGTEVQHFDLQPWFAMPKSLRTREVTFDRSFLLGRYTATLTLHRGYGDTVDTKTISFWVIPWKLLAGVFVGLFLFFLLIRFIFANFELKRK